MTITTQQYEDFIARSYKGELAIQAQKGLFPAQIRQMNQMYSLPINTSPTLQVGEPASVRIQNFLITLSKEIEEGIDIQERLMAFETKAPTEEIVDPHLQDTPERLLVDLADWFADIIVYCRSEAMKFGLPLETVLSIIMASNFSKLGADGLPIKNAQGKVEKGPNFQRPEPYITHYMFGKD